MDPSQTWDATPRAEPSAPGPRRGACLFLVLAAHKPLLAPSRHALGELDTVTLGRSEHATRQEFREHEGQLHLAVPDPFMSSSHARLVRALGRWVLEDSGSRNGSRVNGRPVTRALLSDGDLIECGQTFFTFRTEVPLSPPPEPVPAESVEALATLWPPLAHELAALRRLAASDVPILLLGESGTGKEVLARAAHAWSGRAGPFVGINCGALPPTLVTSELFGHRRGAFSGALEDRPGLLRSAEGGTLLLDEIGDLPLADQPALLRALELREVLPVGATRPVPVDLRLVSATHQDLEARVERGQFRADLHARLAGHVLRLPPLRERREDFGLLIGALLRQFAGERAERLSLARATARALLRYRWPRNVRELRHCLERALALCAEDTLRPEHLPEAVRALAEPGAVSEDSAPEPETSPAEEGRPNAALLAELLSTHHGNLSAVARALGKDRTQVRRWLKLHQLSVDSFRPPEPG